MSKKSSKNVELPEGFAKYPYQTKYDEEAADAIRDWDTVILGEKDKKNAKGLLLYLVVGYCIS